MTDFLGIIGLLLVVSFSLRGLILSWLNREKIDVLIGFDINFKIVYSLIYFFCLILLLFFIFTVTNYIFGYIDVQRKHNFHTLIMSLSLDLASVIFEEFIFRVFIFLGFINLVREKVFLVLVSSLLFSLSHFPHNEIGYISYFLGGVIYGYSYLKFKSIFLPIGIHFFWNFIQGGFFGFPVSGSSNLGYLNLNITTNTLMNGGLLGPEYSIFGIALRLVIIAAIFLYPYNSKKPHFLISNNNQSLSL